MVPLDPFIKPPPDLGKVYKHYRQCTKEDLAKDSSVTDLQSLYNSVPPELSQVEWTAISRASPVGILSREAPASYAYRSTILPGLVIVPALLSSTSQRWLLDSLLHRDLADPLHLTNLHTHYHIPYSISLPRISDCTAYGNDKDFGEEHRASFFNVHPTSGEAFQPLDDKLHKPLPISKVLDRKLRWVTLGGQYDWTNKRYPDHTPPTFPRDVGEMVHHHFPAMKPEAAIVNIYSPGDTLSLHRDVSEECDEGLVSISVGCDALFVVGLDGGDEASRYHVLRLRSGDALYMSGPARYAWHGVPQVLASTCPDAIQAWPANTDKNGRDPFAAWRGWMTNKRINLNVRQMFAQ